MSLFSSQIQFWYQNNKRDLPWRETNNPYHIWLSEIILQQTRVQQGMAYYEKFVLHFPNVKQLAKASEQQVLNLWQGLGYYSRGRNLHKAAQHVMEKHDGEFPSTFEEIIALPGVGPYTASAIASFAFDLPHAVVDGNVYRVLSRYFNSDTFINTPQGQKYFQELADELLDKVQPAQHNQAIMELGALICKPKNPTCDLCPLVDSCEGKSKNTLLNLPKKHGKIKVRDRHLNYLVCFENNQVLMQKRSEKDIWANMFEFPLVEGEHLEASILENVVFIKTMSHKLTHQNLKVHFYEINRMEINSFAHHGNWIHLKDLTKHPLPRVIDRFLEEVYDISSK